MKRQLKLAICLLGVLPAAALAEIYTDEHGRKMECHDEQVTTTTEKDGHPVAGAIIGGAAGAVVGHQIGSGRGKDVATAVGAVGGAAAGHEIAKGGEKTTTRTERRCTPIGG